LAVAVPRAEAPEEKLTAVMTLASSVDGVELVVGAHEGLTYAVNAVNQEAQVYADELASLSASYLTSLSSGFIGGKAKIALATFAGRALLMADLGEGFTVAILGDPRAIGALLDPVKRIVDGRPLRCPKCGANLEVYTIQCPNCGRRIPFGTRVCPFCGTVIEERRCPNCGTSLRLQVDRVVEASAVEQKAEAAAAAPAGGAAGRAGRLRVVVDGRRVLAAAVVTAAYYLIALGAGLDALTATVAGLVPLATAYTLLFTKE
jgi:RNA polymerase subunit RPABC4/transcription elongation factor Spt4